MKKLTLLFIMLIALSNCSNDDDNNSSQNLPPATQTGANTVGCLVNGNVFLPHKEGINAPVNCFYQFVDGKRYFSMNFADLRGETNERVFIQTSEIILQENTVYTLNNNNEDNVGYIGGGGGYSLSVSSRYFTNAIQVGELTITKLDQSNSIISGTFWFDAINEAGEVVEIREGRFDWDY